MAQYIRIITILSQDLGLESQELESGNLEPHVTPESGDLVHLLYSGLCGYLHTCVQIHMQHMQIEQKNRLSKTDQRFLIRKLIMQWCIKYDS